MAALWDVATSNNPDNTYQYYRDAAKARRIPCSAVGYMHVCTGLVREQFGDLLKSLTLPENWREEIRRKMVAEAQVAETMAESVEREKERLKFTTTSLEDAIGSLHQWLRC